MQGSKEGFLSKGLAQDRHGAGPGYSRRNLLFSLCGDKDYWDKDIVGGQTSLQLKAPYPRHPQVQDQTFREA